MRNWHWPFRLLQQIGFLQRSQPRSLHLLLVGHHLFFTTDDFQSVFQVQVAIPLRIIEWNRVVHVFSSDSVIRKRWLDIVSLILWRHNIIGLTSSDVRITLLRYALPWQNTQGLFKLLKVNLIKRHYFEVNVADVFILLCSIIFILGDSCHCHWWTVGGLYGA